MTKTSFKCCSCTMKLIFVFFCFIPVILASLDLWEKWFEVLPVTKTIHANQKKIICLLNHLHANYHIENDCFLIDKEYKIFGTEHNYDDPEVISEFFDSIKNGSLPTECVFTIFDEKSRSEARSLSKLLMSAKDLDVFFNTAAWARMNFHPDLFSYSFTVAFLKRNDTESLVIPNPYETNPYYFTNKDVIEKVDYIIKNNYSLNDEEAKKMSIINSEDNFILYANYSKMTVNGDNTDENKLSYLTEDIGWNTFYYYYHVLYPSWLNNSDFPMSEDRRGEVVFHFHQQLIARYNLERLSNGLDEVAELSWEKITDSDYLPSMVNHANIPFAKRNQRFSMPYNESSSHEEKLRFLVNYESTYSRLLDDTDAAFYGYNVTDPKAIEIFGNMWQNLNLNRLINGNKYEEYAHTLMSESSEESDTCRKIPDSLLDFRTVLRDPLFYRFQKRILNKQLEFKNKLQPYSKEDLSFPEVKIINVTMDPFVSYFSFFDFNATNIAGLDHNSVHPPCNLTIRQARLDQKPFDMKVVLEAKGSPIIMMKTFLAPNDTIGGSVNKTDNWMNFFEIDSFKMRLTPGLNVITRTTDHFKVVKDDAMIPSVFSAWLDFGKIAIDMAKFYHLLPRRLVFPKGTKTGFPMQLFVIVYKFEPLEFNVTHFKRNSYDNKPIGFPFDRPVDQNIFLQSNCYFKDVTIYHSGTDSVNEFTYTGFENGLNEINHKIRY